VTASKASRRATATRAISGRGVLMSTLERELSRVMSVTPVVDRGGNRYRNDPVGYASDVLGIKLWSRQVECLEAIRDHQRVAVVSGHKCGKTSLVCAAALWFFDSFEDARVIMTSTTSRQVDSILWRELSMQVSRSGRCVACRAQWQGMIDGGTSQYEADLMVARPCEHSRIVPGTLGSLARTGMVRGFSVIQGFTAREGEAVAGISGKNLMFLADEASGIPDRIFEAIEGNRAGGARLVMISNGTRTNGKFFDAFHSQAAHWSGHKISAEETPNVEAGRVVIPGLATRDYIDEKRAEWGENSPQYIVRVRGGFPVGEDGKIFTFGLIGESQLRWDDAAFEGRLFIGVDPAGATGTGDDTAIAVRRGRRVERVRSMRGMDSDAHLMEILRTISEYAMPGERPVVVIDSEGPIGAELRGRIRGHLEVDNRFDLVSVRASDRAIRDAQIYDRLRDVLAASLERWMRDGGAIPSDSQLEQELHSLEWETGANGRSKVTPKDKLRKTLGRSPDRYDAVALCCWEPRWVRADIESQPASVRAVERGPSEASEDLPETTFDPYSSMADPYR
jgi:phage terminase large subunit